MMRAIQLGEITLPYRAVGLAPMAGVSDQPYRRLAKSFGCDWLVSEMVSAKGLWYKNEKTKELMDFLEEERPFGVQLFGKEPEILAEACKMVEATGVDFIDLNMGCPMSKIVNNGEGSALMKTPLLAGEVIASMVKAVRIPITVKIRLGWSDRTRNGLEIAKIAEESGASMVVVHGRTREQMYTGHADWEEIGRIKSALRIPVIGNGDITSPEEAIKMIQITGCDGIQIGRAAQGNPWIFQQVKEYFEKGSYTAEIPWEKRWEILLFHLKMLADHKGETIAVKEMRSHGAWYTKGLKGSAQLRREFSQAQTVEEYCEIARRYQAEV